MGVGRGAYDEQDDQEKRLKVEEGGLEVRECVSLLKPPRGGPNYHDRVKFTEGEGEFVQSRESVTGVDSC